MENHEFSEELYQIDMSSDELMHYGRKGMKWYQNIYTKGKQARTDRKRKQALEKARAAKAANKKKALEEEEARKKEQDEKDKILKSGDRKKIIENKHRFTDDELRQAITRLELEEKLSSPAAKKSIGKGEEVVRDILANSAKNIGQQAVTYAMGYGVNKLLQQVFDDPKVVNPKKGQKDK